MNKIWYVIYLVFGKTIGKVWIFAAIPFRAYAYSVVFNYVLDHALPLKRLRERFPVLIWNSDLLLFDGYSLQDVHNLASHPTSPKGFIKRRKVSKLEFYLVVFFIFGWLDPDSNDDVTDIGYINSIKVGPSGYRAGKTDRSKNILFWYRRWLPEFKQGDVVYGNAFDLGDVRAQYSFCETRFTWYEKFFSVWAWNSRNTAMGFQYLFFGY